MSVYAVIGKNFGDEGKGLATDFFASQSQKAEKSCLVIRHNGGGQAGHTVDLFEKRFVFHQLSSGSFRGADTYWSRDFLPDLLKLGEEFEDFLATGEKLPHIYAHPNCRCTCVDDVLINMALEAWRGESRHGSCGMGINEAVERSLESQWELTLGEVCTMSAKELYARLVLQRKEYLPLRLEKLGLSLDKIGEYGELLSNDNILFNASHRMCKAAQMVRLAEDGIAREYDDVIFEGAQGLLLDEDYFRFAPHLTSSKTGSFNPMSFVEKNLPEAVPELVYVTRTYVTRHGAGPLPHEGERAYLAKGIKDATNIPNPWQGCLRFAPHGTSEEFFAPLFEDADKNKTPHKVSCMVTHLNETMGAMCTMSGDISPREWFESSGFAISGNIYLSSTPYSVDIKLL